MTVDINGMAHVILTVSRFEVAREFYRKLLPFLGMKPVIDSDTTYYCLLLRRRTDGGRDQRPRRPNIQVARSSKIAAACTIFAFAHASAPMSTNCTAGSARLV